MTSHEILKQANRVVADLIKEKTPPVFETCRSAYKALGELVAYANKSDDEVTQGFAEGINEVISQLEAFRAGFSSNSSTKKEMPAAEFATYVKDQVEKALTEETVPALTRLHALKAALAKSSWAGTDTVTIEVYDDPWHQAKVQVDSDGKKVTAGQAQLAEVSATPGISLSDIMKSMTDSVEKSARDRLDIDSGWSLDLTSPEFLRGERVMDFGRDGSKS